MRGLVIDLFAGGGGASLGLEAALGRPVDIALNHDPVALAAHKKNHPLTLHLEADIWKVKPLEATRGRPVDVLWASPDCTHHSKAKGGKPRSDKRRSLAWAVIRWAAATKPRFVFLENVEEFADWGPLYPEGTVIRGKDVSGLPIPERKGESFDRWVRRFRSLGYLIDFRELVAAHYGAPTKRKRIYIVARRDGVTPRWPAPTHGPFGPKLWHPAAEIIDWSLPCPSIFDRKKPLAEKTLWRIARGLRKYVLEAAEPFIVHIDNGSVRDSSKSIHEPLSTVVTKARHTLVAPTLVQTGYGEREGQQPRALNIREPLGTIVAGGSKHALVSAFLTKFYGDPNRKSGGGQVLGQQLGLPIGAITARDHHGLAAATLIKMRGECHSADLREPLPTVTASGTHLAEVRAFLTAYYGTEEAGQSLLEPMRTVTTKGRLGLVTVQGCEFQIVDIGLRMLRSHELARGMLGRFADGYDLSAADTEEKRIALVGNMVCPEQAEAIIRENVTEDVRRAA